MRCMNCGSEKVAPLKSPTGNKYMLTEVNSETNRVNIGNGFIVDVIGCTNCGFVHLINEDLKNATLSNDSF